MIARVRGVIAASTRSGSMHHVSGVTSTMTGRAPAAIGAYAVAANVRAGTITSSPHPTSSALHATSIVTVPFIIKTPWRAPWYAAKASSNAAAFTPGSGKPPHSPPRTTSDTASTYSSSGAGHAGYGVERTGVPPFTASSAIVVLSSLSARSGSVRSPFTHVSAGQRLGGPRSRPAVSVAEMGARVVVIGGGSAYMPGIAFALAHHAEAFGDATLVLQDVDAGALDLQRRLTSSILRSRGAWRTSGWRPTPIGPERWMERRRRARCLPAGGSEARHLDERIAIDHGVIGQETAGPGGFAMALRSVPIVLEIAEEMRRLATSKAVLLDYTNPVQVVSEAWPGSAIGAVHRALRSDRRRSAGSSRGCWASTQMRSSSTRAARTT